MASKKYQLKKLKKKIFKNNKKEKQRMMKNLCLGSIGAVSAVNVLALTCIFMPKKSKDNQELSSHVLAQYVLSLMQKIPQQMMLTLY